MAMDAVKLDARGRILQHKWNGYAMLEKRPFGASDALVDGGACSWGTAHLFHSSEHLEICQALAICNTCEVVEECLEEQKFYQAPGIWGGVRWIPKSTRGGKQMKPDSRYLAQECASG